MIQETKCTSLNDYYKGMRYRALAIRIFLLGVLLFVPNTAYSQYIGVNYYYQGVWNGWDGNRDMNKYHLYGNKNGFRVYKDGKRPADFFFRFWITDYNTPEKKDIKMHYKTNTKWVYNGYVEYYICDVYPTFENCLKELHRPLYEEDTQWFYEEKLALVKANQIRKTGSFSPIGYKKVTKPAEIWILPYKKYPKVYNIWFDNVGYAIDLGKTDEFFGKQ